MEHVLIEKVGQLFRNMLWGDIVLIEHSDNDCLPGALMDSYAWTSYNIAAGDDYGWEDADERFGRGT
ncbi:hypothetical protein CU048_03190 [Beijerinckiaceae bacterium]|nr:hypothetical protein CU048_03190 [Beijerinckiaceae bacterium]